MFRITIRGFDEFVVRAIQVERAALVEVEVGVALVGATVVAEALVGVAVVRSAFVETGVVRGVAVSDSFFEADLFDVKEAVVGAPVDRFDSVDSRTVVPKLTIWKNKFINK